MMKICPVCGAKSFSDMDICYSCLFDYAAHYCASEPFCTFEEAKTAREYTQDENDFEEIELEEIEVGQSSNEVSLLSIDCLDDHYVITITVPKELLKA